MLKELFFVDKGRVACPIYLVTREGLSQWCEQYAGRQAQWVQQNGFVAERGSVLMVPDKSGHVEAVLVGQGKSVDYWSLGNLVEKLPEAIYRLANPPEPKQFQIAALAWGLGCYRFDKYKKSQTERSYPSLVVPKEFALARLCAQIEGVFLARDLINTPANDMGPEALEAAARNLAEKFKADFHSIIGDDLLAQDYPLIHAVGRAAPQAPRFIEINWGETSHPCVTLVGKGVCFDSGGLNLKPGNSMELMKKDMGGAACVLGLAHILMTLQLPIRLRVLIGAVENAIGENAFRPGDILPSRKKLHVEIGNTDAEGRLVLADLLTAAQEQPVDLLIDMATLTGAARVALGPEIAPFYTPQDDIANELASLSMQIDDPMWRMPLWAGYDGWLSSKNADLNNISSGPFAGSITAALFLNRFVDTQNWIHCDVYGWHAKPRPARPVGGEGTAIRALFHLIEARYGD